MRSLDKEPCGPMCLSGARERQIGEVAPQPSCSHSAPRRAAGGVPIQLPGNSLYHLGSAQDYLPSRLTSAASGNISDSRYRRARQLDERETGRGPLPSWRLPLQ